MGGKRKSNPEDLPPRMYKRRGSYYYVLRATGAWILLGRDLSAALIRADDLAAGNLGEPRQVDYDRIYSAAMKNAAARRIEWKLTPIDWAALLSRAGGRCEVTGMKFLNTKGAHGRRRPWMPSLDRINNHRGLLARERPAGLHRREYCAIRLRRRRLHASRARRQDTRNLGCPSNKPPRSWKCRARETALNR
jgi:hypothetical protein